jgi:hypothetical protein
MAIAQPMVIGFRTSTYARNIYLYGNTALTAIPTDYYISVEQYAAATFSLSQIDNALAQGWITQAQYDETVAYIV